MRPYIFAFIARVINTLTERAAMNVFNVAKVMVCLLRGKSHTLILATIGAKYTYTNTTGEVLAIVGINSHYSNSLYKTLPESFIKKLR